MLQSLKHGKLPSWSKWWSINAVPRNASQLSSASLRLVLLWSSLSTMTLTSAGILWDGVYLWCRWPHDSRRTHDLQHHPADERTITCSLVRERRYCKRKKIWISKSSDLCYGPKCQTFDCIIIRATNSRLRSAKGSHYSVVVYFQSQKNLSPKNAKNSLSSTMHWIDLYTMLLNTKITYI